MIKKFKVELIAFALLIIIIFVSYGFDPALYLYFKNLNYNLGSVYLKEFFINITEIGDSFFYFVFLFVALLLVFFFKKSEKIILKKIHNLKNLILYLIICLAASGIVAQLIKHIIGRARPNHISANELVGFDFFTTNSNFHSFPSGHATTIFILAFVFSSIVPKLKYVLFAFATIVAFSRVAVGAHFITDILGGLIVASISYKLINFFLPLSLSNFLPKKNSSINNNLFVLVLIPMLLIAALLTIGPTFDIFFSSLFYKNNSQFLLQSFYLITVFFRDFILPMILIYSLILPIISNRLSINKVFFHHVFLKKEIYFIWSSSFIVLVLFINLFLKNIWGRARPGDTLELGGGEVFSPWFVLSDACQTNCSFVSGDAAVGFLLIVFYFILKNNKYIYLSLIMGFSLGFIRVAEGGHFLSDVVFSGIIVYVLTYFIKKIFDHRFL